MDDYGHDDFGPFATTVRRVRNRTVKLMMRFDARGEKGSNWAGDELAEMEGELQELENLALEMDQDGKGKLKADIAKLNEDRDALNAIIDRQLMQLEEMANTMSELRSENQQLQDQVRDLKAVQAGFGEW